MSQDKLSQIVARAAEDAEFRKRLSEAPGEVAREFGVSEEEVKKLLDAGSFEGGLDSRVSKRSLGTKFAGFSGPMGIDGISE